MPGSRFLDTNVLIYAFAAGDRRSARAEALLAEGGVIGVQVLNEFTNVLRGKLGWEWPDVEAALQIVGELTGPARPLTSSIHSEAVELARDNTLSFYDALIIAATADAGCAVLLTEDLQHGRRIGGVTIRNPFLPDA
jgi:predicted nucleic acid-binding protein